MAHFPNMFPNSQAILDLEVADLAGLLLEFLKSLGFDQQRTVLQTNFITGPSMVDGPRDRRTEVQRAVSEAWAWLIREGLVIPRPDGDGHNQFAFSRSADQIRSRIDFKMYCERSRFPKDILHPKVAESAWPLFLRGEYDTSAFQAFKEIEVAVRIAGGFATSEFGKDLMRRAFRPANESLAGPLCDSCEPLEEQKSLQEWFAGAYGRVRNPTAHRHGVLNDPTEAFELLVTASHLMRVVDRRRPSTASNSG